MPDPTGRVSHLPHFHRGVAWKEPVRAATTANITISTALNNGDSLDGVTLATGDRVLVKDQSTGSQNGIYVVGASPGRDYDMDQDATSTVPASEVLGAFVYVLAGTTNGGKVFHATNTSVPVLGTTALVFTEFTAGSAGVTDHGDLTGLTTDTHTIYLENFAGEGHVQAVIADAGSTETLDLSSDDYFDITLTTGCTLTLTPPADDGKARVWSLIFRGSFTVVWPGTVVWMDSDGTAPVAAATLAVELTTIDGGTSYMATAGRGAVTALTVQDEGTPLTTAASTLNFVGSAVVASGSGTTKTITITSGGIGEILISDTPSTPLVFADLIQTEAQDDLVYADT